MVMQEPELRATVFTLSPPKGFSNGRELLDSLISDTANASQGTLRLVRFQRQSLVLPRWSHKVLDPPGLHRYLDLRFRVLWPHSDSPGLEVILKEAPQATGNAAGQVDAFLEALSPWRERFPEAAKWVRNVSDISLTAHIHAVSTWFRAAESAGWNPRRMPLTEIFPKKRFIIWGQGRKLLEGPFKSIILARSPLRIPRRIDLNLVTRTQYARSIEAFEAAFRRFWPSLPVSIRHARIEHFPMIAPPALSLLAIPDDEDIVNSPWIDWLRKSEAAGSLFKIVRQQSLRSSQALSNMCFDLFMLAGGVPWAADIEEQDATVLGLDAGHNRDERWSRWVCARLKVGDNTISCCTTRTELAEHIPTAAAGRILPTGGDSEVLTVFRDGRFMSESPQDISPRGMTVSVVKHPRAVLYRQFGSRLRSAKFGDALLYPDGRVLLQTSSNRDVGSNWKMPIRISVEHREQIERAVYLTVLLCRQPALGVYQQPRLPSPVYWADLISKTTSDGWPKVVGRGLGLESIIP